MSRNPIPRFLRSFTAVLLTSVLFTGFVPTVAIAASRDDPRGVSALTPVGPNDGLSRALANGVIDEAEYALERAASVFSLRDVRERFGDVVRPDPRLATILLRDLAMRIRDLPADDRRRAIALMARPDDSEKNRFQDDDPEYGNRTVSTDCNPDACVHWVSTGDHPSFDHAATDAFAGDVLTTLGDVWAAEVTGDGYREPKNDTNVLNTTSNGGDGRFDVYLADLLPDGLFGYCFTNDAKLLTNFTTWDFSAYCVLDNDYVGYGYADPMDPLQVTMAHEFFHAVQFAYDADEDIYFMEGTATWMEDEVYDDINDNHFYLDASPLSNPTVPLDKFAGLRVYGTWLWWRHLSESLADADVIRDIWSRADGAAGGQDNYGTQAVAKELASRGSSFGEVFADFSAKNLKPEDHYEEGVDYRRQRVQRSRTISTANRTFSTNPELDHMTSYYLVLKRGSGVDDDAKLKVLVDGPVRKIRPQASVVLFATGGGMTIVPLSLNDEGRASKRVDFGVGVAKAVVVAANASTRFKRCFRDLPRRRYSCFGFPVHDDQVFRLSVSLVQ